MNKNHSRLDGVQAVLTRTDQDEGETDMTGMGFDGLVVNHGGLNEVTDHLYKMVKDIDDRMNNLERDLAPLQARLVR